MRAHEWTVIAEFDAGYVIGRCQVCGQQDLLDLGALLPDPRPATSSQPQAQARDRSAATLS
jgi:hypothetical protein